MESLEVDELPTRCAGASKRRVTASNAVGGAFDWLDHETDLYSDSDLAERENAIGLMELVRINQDIGDAVGIEVDLVTKDSLKWRIGTLPFGSGEAVTDDPLDFPPIWLKL